MVLIFSFDKPFLQKALHIVAPPIFDIPDAHLSMLDYKVLGALSG